MTTTTVDLQHIAARLHAASLGEDGPQGATLDVDSLDPLKPGEPAYVVGGESDTVGRKIDEVRVRYDNWTPGAVFAAVQVLRSRAGGDLAGRYVGTWWVEEDGEFVLDVSGKYADLDEALRVAAEREEIAIWDNGLSREILVAA